MRFRVTSWFYVFRIDAFPVAPALLAPTRGTAENRTTDPKIDSQDHMIMVRRSESNSWGIRDLGRGNL